MTMGELGLLEQGWPAQTITTAKKVAKTCGEVIFRREDTALVQCLALRGMQYHAMRHPRSGWSLEG